MSHKAILEMNSLIQRRIRLTRQANLLAATTHIDAPDRLSQMVVVAREQNLITTRINRLSA